MEFTPYEWLAIILAWLVIAGVIARFLGRCISEFSSDYSDLKRIKNVVQFKYGWASIICYVGRVIFGGGNERRREAMSALLNKTVGWLRNHIKVQK